MSDARRGTYGHRARIGLLVPSTNTVGESEFWRLAPPGVSVHTSRMPFLPDKHAEPFAAMEAEVPRVLEEAVSAAPDVIAYGCTASSAKGDPSVLEAELSGESGRPTATAAGALVAALKVFGARRIALVTPYPPETNAKERTFFAENGIEVVADESVIVDEAQLRFRNMCLVPKAKLVERAIALGRRGDVDAVVLSCADMPTFEALPEIEAAIGKPVTSSIQALFWRALRLAGIEDRNPAAGRLLARY